MAALERAARVLRDCARNHDPARDRCSRGTCACRNGYGMQATSPGAAAGVLSIAVFMDGCGHHRQTVGGDLRVRVVVALRERVKPRLGHGGRNGSVNPPPRSA